MMELDQFHGRVLTLAVTLPGLPQSSVTVEVACPTTLASTLTGVTPCRSTQPGGRLTA